MTPQAKEGSQDFTVRLEFADYRRLKIQALEERRKMVHVLRDALRNYLDLHEAGTRAGSK